MFYKVWSSIFLAINLLLFFVALSIIENIRINEIDFTLSNILITVFLFAFSLIGIIPNIIVINNYRVKDFNKKYRRVINLNLVQGSLWLVFFFSIILWFIFSSLNIRSTSNIVTPADWGLRDLPYTY